PVTRKTMLSHAEVQGTLGIAQRQKWDFTRLPFNDSLRGAHAIGDWMRSRIGVEDVQQPQVFPADARLEAIRNTPTRSTLTGATTGSIPSRTVVTLAD